MAQVSIMMTTFFVNYVGQPFNQPIYYNVPMIITIGIAYFVLFVILTGNGEPVEDMLDLVPLPEVCTSLALCL